jgi:hypothetical protein
MQRSSLRYVAAGFARRYVAAMVLAPPRTMEPAAAADVLRQRLVDPTKPMTVADASVASGLALRDVEVGLTWLTSEYRGHLRVTEDGDLVHLFPHGFTKPWETQERLGRVLGTIGRALLGGLRFVVRAWLLFVMVAYALLFVALIIAMTVARQGSNDRDSSPAIDVLGGLLRMIADALFWTFHPFSPVYLGSGYAAEEQGRQEQAPKVPLYEKVNRFVFGPVVVREDEQAVRARILGEIRAQKGRIGLADVMRVTGLPRHEADPMMARLMLDHDGTVDVGEQGGIVYRFEALRRSAEAPPAPATARPTRTPSAWERPVDVPPLTGNSVLANIGITLLNGLNLSASAWAIAHGLTLANAALLFDRHRPVVLPNDGLPLVLGVVPLVFSLAMFTLPLARSLFRLRAKKRAAEEQARLLILREVLARAPSGEPVPDEALQTAYRVATGAEPTSKEITRRVVELGGDVDVGPDGEVRYRFADLEAEAQALEEERAGASEAEARLGPVVFASDA